MIKIRLAKHLLILPTALLMGASGVVNAASSSSTLLRFDFNGSSPWPNASAIVNPNSAAMARATWEPVGTVDIAHSTQNSGGLRLAVKNAAGKSTESVGLISGLLAVHNTETNLGKLTLSFDCSVSEVQPITVQIESFDASKKRTGALETQIFPAAPNFYQRSAIDLSEMTASGTGTFQPTAPFVQITLTYSSHTQSELRLDNVNYAVPAYYVSPSGSDRNDGRTEQTAFADPEKAVENAQPGDIILLMDGTFKRAPTTPEDDGVIGFRHGGTPAAWIVLKNYPGQHPILDSDGWNAIKIGRGSSTEKSVEPALAYLEVRGLHIRGNALEAKYLYPDDIDESRGTTNGNGISVEGRFETNAPHHLHFANNLVELCPGGGISTINSDWVTVENNEIRNNCWWNIYGCSGYSFLGGGGNFDGTTGNYKTLIRNNRLFSNEGLLPWKAVHKMSDSNGIIIDTILGYQGRILIESNLSVNNGGSGIHVFRGQRVDIINNTAYMNGAAPLLRWGQIFVQSTDDARILNNILVSRADQPINTVSPNINDKGNTKILRSNNLYFGGAAFVKGENDAIGDPLFVNPTKNFRTADFHLKPSSPALATGLSEAFSPILDLDGKPRRVTPAKGAFDK